MLDILEQKLTSVSKKPISELKKAGINYFNSGSEFTYQGQIYSVGTSYGRNEKLAQIRNAIMLTAEEPQKFDINGLFNENSLKKPRCVITNYLVKWRKNKSICLFCRCRYNRNPTT